MVTTAGATLLTTSAYERIAPVLSVCLAGGSETSSRPLRLQDGSARSATTASAAHTLNARSFSVGNILPRNLNYRRRRVGTVWRRAGSASYTTIQSRSPGEQGLIGLIDG